MFSIKAAPDQAYWKMYFTIKPDFFRTNWIGAYSFCKSNDLELLSFESQHEHDYFPQNLQRDRNVVPIIGSQYQIYLGSFATTNRNASGYSWYRSGEPVQPTVQFSWLDGQPDGYEQKEFCTTIVFNPQNVGVSDYNCYYSDIRALNNIVVCQNITDQKKQHGYKNLKNHG